MKKLILLLRFKLITLSSSPSKVSSEINEPTNYIILIVGQSNTHYGIGYDFELDKSVENIKQLGRFGNDNMKIIDAKEPLHHHTIEFSNILLVNQCSFIFF